MLKPATGMMAGVSLSRMVPGLCYEVSPALAEFLITSGNAEYLVSSNPVVPATDSDPDSHIFGGVIVIQCDEVE